MNNTMIETKENSQIQLGRIEKPTTIIQFTTETLTPKFFHYVKDATRLHAYECVNTKCYLCDKAKELIRSQNYIERDEGKMLFRKATTYADVKIDGKLIKLRIPNPIVRLIDKTLIRNDYNKFRKTLLNKKKFVILMDRSHGPYPEYTGYFLNRDGTRFKGRSE